MFEYDQDYNTTNQCCKHYGKYNTASIILTLPMIIVILPQDPNPYTEIIYLVKTSAHTSGSKSDAWHSLVCGV